MKGILIAGVFAAFAITVIDSLECRQCSLTEGIQSCNSEATECTDVTEGVCVESLINSTLGGSLNLYENKFCSKDNCIDNNENVVVSFTVHVSDDQQFNFESQCCKGKACSDNNKDSGPRILTNTQCPSCYGNNTEPCKEETQQCSEGEQCVHIIIQYGDEGDTKEVELKGCSDISNTTCKTLDSDSGSVKVGEFTFQKVNCTNATTIPGTTPTTVTTTPTIVTTTPDSSTSIKASFIFSVFGSLLLLKLLF